MYRYNIINPMLISVAVRHFLNIVPDAIEYNAVVSVQSYRQKFTHRVFPFILTV